LLASKFKVESRKTLKLAGPIVLGQVGQNLITLADTLMVGALGATALAASAFAGSLFVIFLLFGLGTLAPVTALFAKMHGQDDHPQGGVLLRHSLIVALLMSALMIGGLYILKPFLGLFGQTSEILEQGTPFLVIITWSILPSLLYQTYKQLTDGIGQTAVGMWVMALGVILNIFGNYILIYGHFGAPAFGLIGAGYSTLFARCVMAVVMMVYVHRSAKLKKYLSLPWMHNLDHHMLRTMMRLGLPNGLIYLFEVGAFSGAAIIMGWFGPLPLAAHQITISVASMTFLFAVGIGIASSIRVGYELGRGDRAAARHAGFTSIYLSLIYMAFMAVAFLILRHWIPTMYVKDAEVIELAATFFIVVAVFQLFDGVQAVAMGALRGYSDTAWPSSMALISYWVIGLPLGYFLAFKTSIGPVGIWIGLAFGLACAATLFTWRFNKISKLKS